MAEIEWYAAESVYDPPSHAQGVKVTGTRTLLFIARAEPPTLVGTPILAAIATAWIAVRAVYFDARTNVGAPH